MYFFYLFLLLLITYLCCVSVEYNIFFIYIIIILFFYLYYYYSISYPLCSVYCATLLEVRIIHKVSNRCAFHYSLLIAQVCEIASIVSQRRFSSFHKSKESTKYLYETPFSLYFHSADSLLSMLGGSAIALALVERA